MGDLWLDFVMAEVNLSNVYPSSGPRKKLLRSRDGFGGWSIAGMS